SCIIQNIQILLVTTFTATKKPPFGGFLKLRGQKEATYGLEIGRNFSLAMPRYVRCSTDVGSVWA
ncbi:hypothetical protein, partial [Rhodoferax sp.]|uniref:hypothetical protein n=1 Tax=Rhodoferax sp. TaxID=50421 RepID=UPI0027581857|nr:hypothetical protein [Rhodoferax sp.]